jgi:hypothetical protein
MRHRVRRITCEDHTGKRYQIEFFVITHQETTSSGVIEVDSPAECWFDAGDTYQPVQVVEPFDVFTFVDQGQIVTLRRVRSRGNLPSFLF